MPLLRDVFGEYLDPQDPRFWDPEEFFPRHWKIRNKGKSGIVPFELWDHQVLMSAMVKRAYAERKYIATVKPRKLGSSTFWSGIITQHVCWRPAVYCGIVAQRDKVAKEIAGGVMRMHKYCPPAVQPKADTKNKTTLKIPGNDSQLDIASIGQDDPLRGATGIHALLATEICKWRDADEKWASMLANVPHGEGFVVAESTPLYYGDPLHKLYEQADEVDSGWLKLFIPWTMVGEYSIEPPPTWDPRGDVLDYANKHGLTRAQAYWMAVKGLPDCMGRVDLFRAEYPIDTVDCWLPGGEAVFNTARLLKMSEAIDGNTNLLDEPAGWTTWAEPQPDHRYIVTVDPAGSYSQRDFWAIQVFDIDACEQVAEFLGHGDSIFMAREVLAYAVKYGRATLYVENNGVGDGFLSVLVNSGYSNIYWPKGGSPGWNANKVSKARAIANLQSLIQDESMVLHSKRAIQQLINYRGQWDGLGDRDVAGGHYDLVAALALAAWAWHEEGGGTRLRVKSDDTPWRQKVLDYNRNLDLVLRGGLDSANQTPWGRHI